MSTGRGEEKGNREGREHKQEGARQRKNRITSCTSCGKPKLRGFHIRSLSSIGSNKGTFISGRPGLEEFPLEVKGKKKC